MTTKYLTDWKPICYSQMLSKGDSNSLTTNYAENQTRIFGDKFISGVGMQRADDGGKYTASDKAKEQGFYGLYDLAKEGTAVKGGNPDIILNTVYNNTTTYEIALGEDKHIHIRGYGKDGNGNSHILSDDKIDSIGDKFSTVVQHIKIWCAATAAGGGGAYNGGGGGSAGGFAIFPTILSYTPNSNAVTIVVGGRGVRDDGGSTDRAGGNDTAFHAINYETFQKQMSPSSMFARLHGGWRGRPPSDEWQSMGGGVSLFGYGGETVSMAWSSYLGYGGSSLECGCDSSFYKINMSFNDFCYTMSGGPGGNGNQTTSLAGSSSHTPLVQWRDYNNLYNLEGSHHSPGGGVVINASSGGGASAFFGSKGGNGFTETDKDGNGVRSNGGNGLLGGGGGSGAGGFLNTHYPGGYGGNGCVHLWIPCGLEKTLMLGREDGGDLSNDNEWIQWKQK